MFLRDKEHGCVKWRHDLHTHGIFGNKIMLPKAKGNNCPHLTSDPFMTWVSKTEKEVFCLRDQPVAEFLNESMAGVFLHV